MADERPHLTVIEHGAAKEVQFADRKILDEVSISELGAAIAKLVSSSPGVKLLLNFKNVEHLSSAALGMLITVNNQVTHAGGKLRLSNIAPPIFEVFKITRLDKLFEIHETAGHALDGF